MKAMNTWNKEVQLAPYVIKYMHTNTYTYIHTHLKHEKEREIFKSTWSKKDQAHMNEIQTQNGFISYDTCQKTMEKYLLSARENSC